MKKRNLFTLSMCAVITFAMAGCSSGSTEQQTMSSEVTTEVKSSQEETTTEEKSTEKRTLSEAVQNLLEKYETMYTTTSDTPSEQETTTEKPTTTEAPTTTEEETTTETKESDIAPKQTHTFKGSGDDVITGVKVEKVSFVRFIYNGDSHVAVKAHHDDTYELLVNESDPYKGDTLLLPYDSEITFEIKADSAWTLEIYEIGYSSADSFSGNSDTVTGFFKCTSDIYQITFAGDSHFAVKGYYEKYDDYRYELLVNESDPYSGKVFLKKKGDYAFFEITGEGEWSIEPVK